jgi:SAM-dependent methyltransferase
MGKLSGQAYQNYWSERIARGPEEVSFDGRGADRQGNEIWEFIEPCINSFRPDSVLDFGCGYGRMMNKLRDLWPAARIYGVDLCRKALDFIQQNWSAGAPPELSTSIPDQLTVDLIFDCMALQHVTDEAAFEGAVMNIYRLQPGGALVLFENVSKPKADHVRDMSIDDYLALWPGLNWKTISILRLQGQAHALMIGVHQ